MEGEGAATPTDSLGAQSEPTQGAWPGEWVSQLSDESLRSNRSLARFKDIDGLSRSYLELERRLGQRPEGILAPLTAQSTPEQIAAYRKTMGIPETPAGYQVKRPQYPEGVGIQETHFDGFVDLAHRLHLTPSQVQEIFEYHARTVASDLDAANTAALKEAASSFDKLKERFGPLADQKLLQAREYMRRRFGEDGTNEIEAMGLGNNPTLIEILAESAVLTGHDKFVTGDSRGGGFTTKESAMQELMRLRQQHSDGKLSEYDFKVQFDRLAPIAYSEPGDTR